MNNTSNLIEAQVGLLKYQECGVDEKSQFEKIHTVVFEDPYQASKTVAGEIAEVIKNKSEKGKLCVLGLATGSTPKSVYKELIRLHREDGLSFKHVVTFNLDEYYPLSPDDQQSYYYFMHNQLFDHIDIPPENVNIPSGTVKADLVDESCKQYEDKIEQLGGIDLQILGIGRTGHIGFNEPGSHINSRTRRVSLDHLTRSDAAEAFMGEENVPRHAITMGVGSIMNAKRIIIMGWGEAKAEILKKAIEGPITDSVPSTFLQRHNNVTAVIDEAAAVELTRLSTPWLVHQAIWNNDEVRKSVIWLALKIGKPILKLTDYDYADNFMGGLIDLHGPAYDINIRVFNQLQRTITGWPGGKPGADDSYRPERAEPAQKRVLIFSPHPDDDVISMGGTLMRLVEQGHEVHVVHQTSGSNAVFDDEVVKYLQFVYGLEGLFNDSMSGLTQLSNEVNKLVSKEELGEQDAAITKQIKGLIRRGEARASAQFAGVQKDQVHFLDMPFYQNKDNRKLDDQDIGLITDVLEKIQPHQVFIAGDLLDPHGTHRLCYEAIHKALNELKIQTWMKDCYVWMYRGAWQEWNIDEIDMAVPLSPDELTKKRKAIFKHQTQKDIVMYRGDDSREFWQRSESRNRNTAETYKKLGLADYEAIEGFVRMRF